MLTFSIITLFPDWFTFYGQASIIGRAQQSGIIKIDMVNPRDFTTDVHHKVDDSPYGGGAGMVMMCKPVMDAYHSLGPLPSKTKVMMTSPLGRPFSQKMAEELTEYDQIVVLCGHYEGIDARIQELIPNLELFSLGDFVLTGGELPALCLIDAVTRLLPGALGKDASAEEESFGDGLLEYPHYTRPAVYEGLEVPPILLSGNHEAIRRWRRQMSLQNTLKYRPELLGKATLSPEDETLLKQLTPES